MYRHTRTTIHGRAKSVGRFALTCLALYIALLPTVGAAGALVYANVESIETIQFTGVVTMGDVVRTVLPPFLVLLLAAVFVWQSYSIARLREFIVALFLLLFVVSLVSWMYSKIGKRAETHLYDDLPFEH